MSYVNNVRSDIASMFNGLGGHAIDYSSIMPNDNEQDIDFLCSVDQANTPKLPDIAEVREDRARVDHLNDVIDIQEQMAKGMVFIKKQTQIKDAAFNAYAEKRDTNKKLMALLEVKQAQYDAMPYDEKAKVFAKFKTWKQNLWDRAKPLQAARNDLYSQASSEQVRLNKYWARWNKLREECNELNPTAVTWAKYFALANLEISPYWSTSDAEDIDNQVALLESDPIECLADTHVTEMKAYEGEVFVDWTFHDERIAAREENYQADMDSMLEACPF